MPARGKVVLEIVAGGHRAPYGEGVIEFRNATEHGHLRYAACQVGFAVSIDRSEAMMVRFAARGGCVVAGVMLIGSVALAASPPEFYIDKTHHVTIILAQTNVVTPTVTCDGKHYVPPRGVFLESGGRFSYSGPADKESAQRPPSPTKMKLSVSGKFKTKHLVTGKASVAGCKVNYSATYMQTM